MTRKPDFLSPQVISSAIDKDWKLKPLLLIGSVFITAIIITNVIGTKIMTFAGFNFTAGIITYALVFWSTDVVGEIWGKRTAYYMVLLGFIGSIIAVIFIQIAIHSAPAVFWLGNQESYAKTLGPVSNIVFASMCAYIVSQLHDVWAFDFWRRKTKGRYLFVRNNLSTMTSQVLDSIIFITIAFGATQSTDVLISIIKGQILIKWILALLDTPLIILTIKFLGGPVEGAHENFTED